MPGGIANTGVSFVQVGATDWEREEEEESVFDDAPERPSYGGKKTEESGGVIEMINTLMADIDKDVAELETGEKLAQEDYEKFMSDSKDKRAEMAKSIKDKE